jgi:hypothetical protein
MTTLQEKLSQLPLSPRASRALWHELVSRLTCAQVAAVPSKSVSTFFSQVVLASIARLALPEEGELVEDGALQLPKTKATAQITESR